MEPVMAESDRSEAELPVNQQKPYGEYGTQELFGETYHTREGTPEKTLFASRRIYSLLPP
jgi:hypothetical protein